MGFTTKRSSALAVGLAVLTAAGAIGTGIALAAGTHISSSTPTIGVKKTSLGSVLYAGPRKLTVYGYAEDRGTKSACDQNPTCAEVWPAVKTSGKPKAGAGVSAGALGTAKEGKFTQATYHGHLLYYFATDNSASSTRGQGIDATGGNAEAPVWFAISASGAKVTKGIGKRSTSTSSKGGGGWG